MTVEERLREWMRQGPTCGVSPFEWAFLAAVRDAAKLGVGFGWMQQVVEWEWQDKCERDGPSGGAWGPEYFNRRIAELEAANAELVAAANAMLAALDGSHAQVVFAAHKLRAALSRVTPPPEG